MEREKLALGITIGDFNGVSPEIILKILKSKEIYNYCIPVIYGHKYVFEFYEKRLGLEPLEFNVVKSAKDIDENKVNFRICSNERINITPGVASKQAGEVAVKAIELAAEDIKKGLIKNVVTGPIDKQSVSQAGFNFPGHTEFFAKSFEAEEFMMLLCCDELIIGTVTGHIPVGEVKSNITTEKIESKLEIIHQTLSTDFLINKPKIAVLSLNPHAGDQGAIGDEEIKIIQPVIENQKAKGRLVYGPFSPDGFFGMKGYEKYDAVLAMYHDQALIPFKQIAFEDGVNFTAGLPIIRTSPDHGTAYDIAGKGVASITSFVNAIYQVGALYKNRLDYYETNKNPLTYSKFRKERFSIGIPDLK